MERSRKLKFCPSLRPLPEDFAEQVLNLEMAVELEHSLEALKKLLELYSRAVEHFEAKRDPKFQYYTERMTSILKKQDSLLSSGPVSKKKTSLQSDRAADRAIKSHTEKNARTTRKAQQNIDSQQSSLTRRLSARRFILRSESPKALQFLKSSEKLGNSMTITPKQKKSKLNNQCEGESDRSGGLPSDRGIEYIMEKYAVEKLQRIHDVKTRYKHAKEDLGDNSDDPTFTQVAEEMDKKMQLEINEIEEDIERKKKEDLQILQQRSFVRLFIDD